ncbi:MAG: polymerase III, delta subunit protein [candidate division WS6 bacterium GW2011_GWF2_39_15]|uniref:DNA polymerase III subunit delta n=1 Tax=candidate division WS6 bacterium GW2011_GWF2_39_15 TaxID=1619100 RepID=A0A0G0MR51_9BACT|nr:MAG: polymerase III, delta subunit protein [candidate division WS6 bacterium GW2011_GWF2_39_15]
MFYLFHGSESYLSLKSAKELLEKLCDEQGAELMTIDAEESNSERIINAFSSNGMFSTSQIVFIKRLYRNKQKEGIFEYLFVNTPLESTHYVFWEDQKINKNTKYFKFFKDQITLIDAGNKVSVYNWLKGYLNNKGIESDTDTVKLLAGRNNYTTERIAHEVDKMELAGITKITQEIVMSQVSDTLEVFGWDLTDAINKKDKTNALIILESLVRQQIDPNIIMAILTSNLKQLTQVHLLQKTGAPSNEMAKALGIHPFVISKLQYSAKNISWTEIKAWFKKLTSLDLASKQGNIDPILGLTLLISRIN